MKLYSKARGTPATLLFLLLLVTSSAFAGFRHSLDAARDFTVELRQTRDGKIVAVLVGYKSDHRTASADFTNALQSGLTVVVDGKSVPVQWGHANTKELNLQAREIQIDLFGRHMGGYTAGPTPGKFAPIKEDSYVLSSYDVREFGQRGASYAPDWNPLPSHIDATQVPDIDLHTHLAGSFSYQALIEIAKNNHILYPVQLLKNLGIKYPNDKVKSSAGKESIAIGDLLHSREWKESEGDRKFQEAMSIGRTRIRNFSQMEDRYIYRGPITKNRDALEDLLWKAAREAQEAGIQYTEYSISDVLDPKWLQRAQNVLPEIERATGVKVRFLVGLWRHSDEAWNMDEIEKIKHLAKTSPYIVGVDWMGHETNSTKEIKPQIDEVRKASAGLGNHFQIRIHAGENPLHPENLRDAVLAGATRIGHGLYSDIDDATLKIIKDKGIIIELNPLSNQALNNLSSNVNIVVEQFKKYRAAGIRVTLGTDGSGMYGGSPKETYRMMRQLGLSDSDIAYARESDKAYTTQMEKDFTEKLKRPGSLEVDENLPVATHWKPEIQEKKERDRIDRIKGLNDNLAAKGIIKINPESETFKGMHPIMVTGSSMGHFPEIEKQGKVQDIEHLFDVLLARLDPTKVYFITGGTDFGVEKILHRKAREKGFKVLGILPEEANHSEVRGPEDAGITHWTDGGKTWYAKALIQYDLVAEKNGDIIAIGGKNILADELAAIKTAERRGLAKLHLMRGVVGAANDLAERLPESSFAGPEDLMARLEENIPQAYFKKGVATHSQNFISEATARECDVIKKVGR